MKTILSFLLLVFVKLSFGQVFSIQTATMSPMPEPVTNNSVCEGFIGNTPYVFSFTGLDSTKLYNGIHLKSFRYNTLTDVWEIIPSVPDTMGKIAASANRIKNIIYVIGGYHVLQNGTEVSSNKVHRYDIENNSWLTDGANIPKPIDDQVQIVWRDSLLFVVTGWSNSSNVTNVQIYNPQTDSWAVGTDLPNLAQYKLFGGAGTIIKDTIFYFGGAKAGFNFSPGNTLIKGIIDPNNPTQITWSDTIIDASITAYRAASTNYHNTTMWMGGAKNTYNYDGIAYNNNAGVEPAQQLFFYNSTLALAGLDTVILPMDLRGIATTSEQVRYICGGMEAGQKVTAQTIKITFDDLTGVNEFNVDNNLVIYPNPATTYFKIQGIKTGKGVIYDLAGRKVSSFSITNNNIDVSELKTGIYQLVIRSENKRYNAKITVVRE